MKRIILMALLLLVPILVAVVKTPGHADSKASTVAGTKWEYLAVAGPSTVNLTPTGNPNMRKEEGDFGREGFVLEQQLDRLGAKGWELVSVAGSPRDPVYYFKRPK